MTDKTLVTFVLDKSTSMLNIKSATIEAFNTYVQTLKESVEKEGGEVDMTLVQFSTYGIDKSYLEKPIAEVPFLDDATYRPLGGTPLIDAAYNTIKALEVAVAAKSEKPKVVVCIQTDGEENESREHTWDALRELIASKQAEGWQFNFMGAGIDAYQQASMMGIGVASTVSYDAADMASTRAAFEASAYNTGEFRTGRAVNTMYMASQKMAAGDAFDPDLNRAAVGLTVGKRPGAGAGAVVDKTDAWEKRKDASRQVDLGGTKEEKKDDGLKVTL